MCAENEVVSNREASSKGHVVKYTLITCVRLLHNLLLSALSTSLNVFRHEIRLKESLFYSVLEEVYLRIWLVDRRHKSDNLG